jgi:hypothetical protein
MKVEARGPALSAGGENLGYCRRGSFSGIANGSFHDWPDAGSKRRKHRQFVGCCWTVFLRRFGHSLAVLPDVRS